MIHLREHAEGWVLPVRAQPGAKRNALVGEQAGQLKVAITAPADQGKANKALLEVLADALGLKRSQVQLLSGHTHREKKVLLRDVTLAQLQDQLPHLLVADA